MVSSRELIRLARQHGSDDRIAFHVRAALRAPHFMIWTRSFPDVHAAMSAVRSSFQPGGRRGRQTSVICLPFEGAEPIEETEERWLVEIATAHGKSPVGMVSPPSWMMLSRSWLTAIRRRSPMEIASFPSPPEPLGPVVSSKGANSTLLVAGIDFRVPEPGALN